MPKEIIVTIRGVDERTYHRARTAAVKARMTIGEWLTATIKSKLERKNKGVMDKT